MFIDRRSLQTPAGTQAASSPLQHAVEGERHAAPVGRWMQPVRPPAAEGPHPPHAYAQAGAHEPALAELFTASALMRQAFGTQPLRHRPLPARWKLLCDARLLCRAAEEVQVNRALLERYFAEHGAADIDAVWHAARDLGLRLDRGALFELLGRPPEAASSTLRVAVNGNAGPSWGDAPLLRPVTRMHAQASSPSGPGDAPPARPPEGPGGAKRFAAVDNASSTIAPVRGGRPPAPPPPPRAEEDIVADLGPGARQISPAGSWPLVVELEGTVITLYTGVLLPPRAGTDSGSSFPSEVMDQHETALAATLVWDNARALYVLKTLNGPATTAKDLLDPPSSSPAPAVRSRVSVPPKSPKLLVGCTWVVEPGSLSDATRACAEFIEDQHDGVPRGLMRNPEPQASLVKALPVARHDPLGVNPLHLHSNAAGVPAKLRAYVMRCTFNAAKGCYESAVSLPEHRLSRGKAALHTADGVPTVCIGVIEEEGEPPLFVFWDAERVGMRPSGSQLSVDADLVAAARRDGYADQTRRLTRGRGEETLIVAKAEGLERAFANRFTPDVRRQLFAALGIAEPPAGSIAVGGAVIPFEGQAVRVHVHDGFAGEGDRLHIQPFRNGRFAQRIEQAPVAPGAAELGPPRDVILAIHAEYGAVAAWDAARYDHHVDETPLTVLAATLDAAVGEKGCVVERQTTGHTCKVFAAPLAGADAAVRALLADPPMPGTAFELVDPTPQERFAARVGAIGAVVNDFRPLQLLVRPVKGIGPVRMNAFLYPLHPHTAPGDHFAIVQLPGYRRSEAGSFFVDGRAPLVGGWLDVPTERIAGVRPQRLYALWDPLLYGGIDGETPQGKHLYVADETLLEAARRGVASQPRRLASGMTETVLICTEAALQETVGKRLTTGMQAQPLAIEQSDWPLVQLPMSDRQPRAVFFGAAAEGDGVYVGSRVLFDRLLGSKQGGWHEWVLRQPKGWHPGRRLTLYVDNAAESPMMHELAYVLGRPVIGPHAAGNASTGILSERMRDRPVGVMVARDMRIVHPPYRIRPLVRLDRQGRLIDADGNTLARQKWQGLLGPLKAMNAAYCEFGVGDGCGVVVARDDEPEAAYHARVESLERSARATRDIRLFGQQATLFDLGVGT